MQYSNQDTQQLFSAAYMSLDYNTAKDDPLVKGAITHKKVLDVLDRSMVSKDPQGWQQLKDVNSGWNGKVALLKDKPKLILPPFAVGWIFRVGIVLSLEIKREEMQKTRLCGGSLDSLMIGICMSIQSSNEKNVYYYHYCS